MLGKLLMRFLLTRLFILSEFQRSIFVILTLNSRSLQIIALESLLPPSKPPQKPFHDTPNTSHHSPQSLLSNPNLPPPLLLGRNQSKYLYTSLFSIPFTLFIL